MWDIESIALLTYNKMSLANKEMWWCVLQKVIGSIYVCCLILWARGSSDRTKRSGERGQPWCEPLQIGKGVDRMLLTVTTVVRLEYRTFTITMMPLPKLARTSHKYCHLSQSKAFSASRDSTAQGSPIYLEKCITCSNLGMLSPAKWDFTKPVCSLCTNLFK